MRFKWLILLCIAAWASSAQAAYIGSPPLTFLEANLAGQPLGQTNQGLPTIPIITTVVPPLAPSSPSFAPPNQASIALPFRGAGSGQASLVVSPSPNPSYQCPLTQTINVTANTTLITNPGGKRIYVCNVAVINGATAQSVTLLEGTGTACATNPTNWLGGAGATAALAVNGGFALIGINWAMQVPGNNVCLLVSGSTNVSGTLTYGLY